MLKTIQPILNQDPKPVIERKVSIFGKKIQTQYLILGTSAALTVIGSLLLKEENENEDASRSL